MKPTALFCISSLGLGHATRTLALVNSYIDTHSIHILCTGKALVYLKTALDGKEVTFYDIPDYPPLERGKNIAFYWYLITDSLATTRIIRQEHRFVEKLCGELKPQFIISDGRYGAYVKGIPSCIISHQISFVMPKGFGFFQKIADYFNYKTFKKFDHVFIPDYKDDAAALAGTLSHNSMLEKLPHTFVGILSSIQKKNTIKDIDYLFVLSGYLEEHKEEFIKILIEGAKQLAGKKVFVLGEPQGREVTTIPQHSIEIIPSVSGEQRADLFNRAKYVISRSGYTTIMDLVELETPAYLIPTPGQTEQEYLAVYLGSKQYFLTSSKAVNFSRLLTAQSNFLYKPLWKTKDSLITIHNVLSKLL